MHAQRVREDENYIRRLRKLLKCGEEAFTDDGMVKDETGHGDTRQNTEIKDCIWKAFKIRSRKDFEDAMTSSADAVILDNGYGTGETFDWSILEGAGVMMQEKKFFLAGGLTPDNIEAAIQRMDVWGIDISSGVETDKKKDRSKILAAVPMLSVPWCALSKRLIRTSHAPLDSVFQHRRRLKKWQLYRMVL